MNSRNLVFALVACSVLIGSGCSDDRDQPSGAELGSDPATAAGAANPYSFDDGPGAVGEDLTLTVAQVNGGDATQATKTGRRTYQLDGGGEVSLPPDGWQEAVTTAVEAAAPQASSAPCPEAVAQVLVDAFDELVASAPDIDPADVAWGLALDVAPDIAGLEAGRPQQDCTDHAAIVDALQVDDREGLAITSGLQPAGVPLAERLAGIVGYLPLAETS